MEHDSEHTNLAALVTIAFEFQKNNRRSKAVYIFKIEDVILCPVKAWVHSIKQIKDTLLGASGDTKVCAYNYQGQVQEIDSGNTRARIKRIFELLGKEKLGFTKDDVGLHSIRSWDTMGMFLSGVSTTIMHRVGRWESDAFMECIRE